jgi:hypothetical protein
LFGGRANRKPHLRGSIGDEGAVRWKSHGVLSEAQIW